MASGDEAGDRRVQTGTIGYLQEFQPEKEQFAAYVERVELFFVANEIAEAKQVPVFLSAVGSKTYGVLRNLLAPTPPKDKTFEQIKETLAAHYDPKPLVIVERFHFYRRNQGPTETVNEYVAELRRKAARCKFGTNLEEAIRDRLVCGLKSESTQKRLLTEAELTLVKAVSIAQSMEAAHKQSQTMKTPDLPVGNVQGHGGRGGRTRRSQTRTVHGPAKPCHRCGNANHTGQECVHKDTICHKCKSKGHLARACRSSNSTRRPVKGNHRQHLVDEDKEDSPENKFVELEATDSLINRVGARPVKPYKVTLQLDGKPVEMEIDTGAAVSLIPVKLKRELFPQAKMKKPQVRLRTYTSEVIKVVGEMTVKVTYGDYVGEHQLYVVEGAGPALLGRDWLKDLRLDWASIKYVSDPGAPTHLQEKYADVFEKGIGELKNVEAKLKLKNDAQPRFCRPRPVPYALKDAIGRELDRLEESGVLHKVEHSEWATPIVPVPKKNGEIRICGDYKATLNPALQVDQYPLPKPSDLMACLTGGKSFTKLDLTSAYQQIPLDAESRKLTTITTHQGLYEFTRLPFGIASAPAIFQREMDKILRGIPHVICYLDDILITGETDAEHLKNLEEVLKRLQRHGLRLRLDKCRFFQKRVEYLGFSINEDGVHTTEKKVQAITEAPTPRNVRELRSFLGIINYYAKFVPSLSSILSPLNDLLKAGKRWVWSPACRKAFKEAKERITKAPILAHFDPQLPISLAADASQYGIGAVISHTFPDGSERPIAYASRTLKQSERNYAQIEKEALSLVFGVQRFHQYLYGRSFTLITDHKPLTTILGPKTGIPTLAAARLQRWAIILSAYTYEIQFRPTEKHANADALSRLPLSVVSDGDRAVDECVGGVDDVAVFNIAQLDALPVQASDIALATKEDLVLKKVFEYVQKGWPKQIPECLKPYFTKRNELSIEEGCLYRGIRVIVPTKLRNKILQELHKGHQGMVRMKALARSHVWWPTIDTQLEESVKSCSSCQESRNAPAKAPLHPWEWPMSPWQRIHIDFAGPIDGRMLLVIIDAHSKWPEICVMKSTTASSTVNELRQVFSRYGLPQQVVSDNGPQFIAEEFEQFLRNNGVKHIRSAPYHPASNGAAERLVQTAKHSIKSELRKGERLEKAVCSFLLQYRTTPHATTGATPSMLFYGRNIRTRLDLLKPNVSVRVRKEQDRQKLHHDTRSKEREFEIEQAVWVRNYRDGPKWIKGVVVDKLGPVSYLVKTMNGDLWRRHVDQLRAAMDSENVTDEADEMFFPATPAVPPSQPTPPAQQPPDHIPPPNIPVDTGSSTQRQNSENDQGRRYPSRVRNPPEYFSYLLIPSFLRKEEM